MIQDCWVEDTIDTGTPDESNFIYIDVEELEPRMMVQLSWKGMQNTARKFTVEFYKNDQLFPIKFNTESRRTKKAHYFTSFDEAKGFAEYKMEEWVKIAVEDNLRTILAAMNKYLPRE